MSQTDCRTKPETYCSQWTRVIRAIIQEEVNVDCFYTFVEIPNSEVINRPTAEHQPLVE